MRRHKATPATSDIVSAQEPQGGRSRRPSVWVLSATLLIVGCLASFGVAAGAAHTEADKLRASFRTSSAEVAATLTLAVRHEADLVVSAGGFIAGNPDASTEEFVAWMSAVRALERYPELEAFGLVVIVPADGLAAFAARVEAGDPESLGPTGRFTVVPPGNRAFYCFGAAGAVRHPERGLPNIGVDLCATPAGPALLAARDSGTPAYLPYKDANKTLLAVQTPIYRGGIIPGTVEARREAFLGWAGMAFDPQVVLQVAVQTHPNLAVAFRYHDHDARAVFRHGHVPDNAQRLVIDLHNGWTVSAFGVNPPGGIFDHGQAILLLLAGVAMSLAICGLVITLGTGRSRALRLVNEKTKELHHLAMHDALTGLANRALITDRTEQLLARNRRHGTVGAALYVDLDNFKNINDTLGHPTGDRLLAAVAVRLSNALRGVDTIGRMGGDEFVVLIDEANADTAPELVAERLLKVMRQPFELPDTTLPLIVTASVGIAVGDRNIPDDLLRDADLALYEAKAAGKNRYAIYQPEMYTQISERMQIEFDLRSALGNHEFWLAYQPVYNLDDLTITGVEALLRWNHPTKGTLGPDEFIPALENSGQILDVGRWVLHEGCTQIAAWHAHGIQLSLAINVSGRQLDQDDIVDDVREALTTSGLDPSTLIIEVTETVLTRNPTATTRRLHMIKNLGVSVAIDDFGTGYSSLAYLQQFPVDCLKIDRTFIEAISDAPESQALIRTLVQLGTDLGLRTLAEGIETTQQMDYLRGQNVNDGQGFLFSHPLNATTFEQQFLTLTNPTPTQHTH